MRQNKETSDKKKTRKYSVNKIIFISEQGSGTNGMKGTFQSQGQAKVFRFKSFKCQEKFTKTQKRVIL